MREIVSIGSVASTGEPAPDEFGRIASTISDTAGNLWIADVMNHQISAFSADGALLRRFGREGQGPGEFIQLTSIAWLGDRLLALDLGNGRVSELSDEGEILGSRAAPGRVSGSPALIRLYSIGHDRVYQWSLGEVDGRATRTWVEHGPEGITGEWAQQGVDPQGPASLRCERPDGVISFFTAPFGGKELLHPTGSGNSYAAWSAEYRIVLLSSDGDTLRVIERDLPPEPIRDEEWAAATADFVQFRRDWPGVPCEPSGLSRPDAKAAMNNILVDRDGRLWVEVFTANGTRWEIFDRTGALEASMPGFAYDVRVPPSVSGDLLTWVDEDSLGIQRARMAEIVPGS